MKAIWLMLMLLFLALSMALAGLVFDGITLPYAPEGQYFEAESSVVYQEQSAIGYGVLLALSLLFTLLFAFLAFRSKTGTSRAKNVLY